MILRPLLSILGVCTLLGISASCLFLVRSDVLCFVGEASETRQLISATTCAALGHQRGGLALEFIDGNCMIYGAAPGDHGNTSLYNPPPQFDASLKSEVSRGKPLQASPHYSSSYAKELAIDNSMTSFYHGQFIPNNFWVLDLTIFMAVFDVEIWTRQDAMNGNRFHDVEIRIGSTPNVDNNFSSWTLFAFYQGPYSLDQGRLDFTSASGICGRYVSIQKISADTDPLQLVDVKIYAQSSP